jgi:hypothetical protein
VVALILDSKLGTGLNHAGYSHVYGRIARTKEQELVEWQKKAGILQTGRINESELARQFRDFLHLFRDALEKGGADLANPAPATTTPRRPGG